MKKTLLLFAIVTFTTKSWAAVISSSLNTTLDPMGSLPTKSILIEGKSVNFSFWGFPIMGSGFQIDGNEDFGGMITSDNPMNLRKLNLGEEIGNSGDYVDIVSYAPAFHGMATPEEQLLNDGQSAYFGFRVISGENIYYAWVKITRISEMEMVLDEYAYENVAGNSIDAGDKGLSVGIRETITKPQITIYPNPVVDFLNVKCDNEMKGISIINSAGQIVFKNKNVRNEIQIDLKEYSSGLYFIKINSFEGITTTSSFVKK